jgi:hypothetical protein
MGDDSGSEKQQAHELIERLTPSQVSALVGLLQAMLDPVARAIANAPREDEPVAEEERQAGGPISGVTLRSWPMDRVPSRITEGRIRPDAVCRDVCATRVSM